MLLGTQMYTDVMWDNKGKQSSIRAKFFALVWFFTTETKLISI